MISVNEMNSYFYQYGIPAGTEDSSSKFPVLHLAR